jgi:putative phosphoesterase
VAARFSTAFYRAFSEAFLLKTGRNPVSLQGTFQRGVSDETDVRIGHSWFVASHGTRTERFAASGAQWLVILGDVLNHGPRNALPEGYAPAQVAERLNEQASRIIAVRGNCDSEVDQMLLHFPMTAPWQQILTENQRLFLTHGHLFGPQNMPALNAGDVLVMGILICRLLSCARISIISIPAR